MNLKKMVMKLMSDCSEVATDVFPSRYPTVILKSEAEKDVSKSSYSTGTRSSYITGYTDKVSTWWNSLDEDKVNRDKLKLGYTSDSKCERYTTEEYKYSACIERTSSNKKHKVLEYSLSNYSPPQYKKTNRQITAFNSVSKSFKNKYDKQSNYTSEQHNLLHDNHFPIYSFQKPHYTKANEIFFKNHVTNNTVNKKDDAHILIYENNFPIYSMTKPHYTKWFTSCAEIILIKPKSKQCMKESTLLYNNSWPIYNISKPHYFKTYVTKVNLYIQSYKSETKLTNRKLSYRRYSDGHGLVSPYFVKKQDQLFKHYKSQCVYKKDIYDLLDTEMTGYYRAEVAHIKNSSLVDDADSNVLKINTKESESKLKSAWQKNEHTINDTNIKKQSFNSSYSDSSKIESYERQCQYNDIAMKTEKKTKEPIDDCSFSEYIFNVTKGKYSIPRLNLNTNYKPVYNHSRPPYYTQKHATL